MKKVFAISMMALMFCVGLSSCKKSTTSPTSTPKPQPKMEFYANDVLINCNSTGDAATGWTNYPYINNLELYAKRIDLHGTDNADINSIGFNLGLCQNCTGVAVGQYPLTTNGSKDVDCRIHVFIYNSGYSTGNDYTVNITLIQNGLASGNFFGVLYPSTSDNPIGPILHITKGTFSNIPIDIPLH